MTLQERPSLSMSRWEVADELDRLQTRIDALVASGIQPSLEQAHRENAALCDRILELRKACDELQAENEALRASLLALANAADAVGIRYFDTDDMSDDVQAMEAATIYAREVLRRNASLSGGRRPSAPVRGWVDGRCGYMVSGGYFDTAQRACETAWERVQEAEANDREPAWKFPTPNA